MIKERERQLEEILLKAHQLYQDGDREGFRSALGSARSLLTKLPDSSPLWGEWLLVSLPLYYGDMRALVARLERAETMIPWGSRILPRGCSFFGEDVEPFAACDPRPGHAQETGRYLAMAEQIFTRLTGGGQGTARCYQAQLCFYMGQVDKALALAREAYDLAQLYGQGSIALSSAGIEAMGSIHLGDVQRWHQALRYINLVAAGRKGRGMDHAQVLRSQLWLALGLGERVPEKLRLGDLGVISVAGGYKMIREGFPARAVPAAVLVKAACHIAREEPLYALETADVGQKAFCIAGNTAEIYFQQLRSEAYRQLGEEELNRASLYKALTLASADKLYLIPALFAAKQGERIYQIAGEIDPKAPEQIRQLSDRFIQKVGDIRSQAALDDPAALTPREREVAQRIMAGARSRTIADELQISVRTVERHLASIYRKYGVNSRTQLTQAIKAQESRRTLWMEEG